jgi:hypothetical protein
VTRYDDVGADTAVTSAVKVGNIRKEFTVIRDKLNNPEVSTNKKDKYKYRAIVLQQKFPHILSDLVPGGPRIAY